MAEHVPGAWEEIAARYDEGLLGSRRLMEWEMELVRVDGAALLETAARQPHDPGFVPFVRRAQAAGIPVEVVSDGFGFFIEPALRRLGVPELPVITARTTFAGGRAMIDFPNAHPECLVCGTCKRQRVLAHQAAGCAAVFIGDGERSLRRRLRRRRLRQAGPRPDLCDQRLAVPALDRVHRDPRLAERDARRLAARPRVRAAAASGGPAVPVRPRGLGPRPRRSARADRLTLSPRPTG